MNPDTFVYNPDHESLLRRFNLLECALVGARAAMCSPLDLASHVLREIDSAAILVELIRAQVIK